MFNIIYRECSGSFVFLNLHHLHGPNFGRKSKEGDEALGVMMIVARQEDIAVTQRSIGAILILNADAPEDAERVKANIESKLPGAKIMIEHVGPVIGAHAGPGTVALCFIGKNIRNP